MSPAWESLLAVDEGEGPGPAVLLVHGQPGSAADWQDLRQVPPGGRCLVVDRPGYGRSAVGACGMGDNAEFLADLLAARSAAPAVVVGHSYGGGVALLMAARRPETVAGLVLLGSVGPRSSVNGFDHLLASRGVGEALSAAGLFTVGRVLPRLRPWSRRLPSMAGARMRASLPDGRYGAELSKVGVRMWRSFLVEQRALVAEIGDVDAAMRQVRVPTAVVSGTWDVVVPPAVSAEMASAIAGSELVTLAGVGHFVARDAPERVAAVVRRVRLRAATG